MLPFSFLIVRLYSLNLGSGCSACFFPLSFFSSRLFLILRVLLPFISKHYIEKQKVSSQSGRCGIYTSCFITMTITSSTSHDTSTTTNATGIVIGHQQHHNSPSAFAANNCIRQEDMQAQEDSSVQITWSPSMLSNENTSIPPFLSSSTSLPTRSAINNDNSNTGKSTILGATLNAGRNNNSISNTVCQLSSYSIANDTIN